MAFHPYLFFGSNCRQAFTRYHEIFGGDLVLIEAKDMPGDEQIDPSNGDLIMHAALRIDGQLLMGSDDPTTASFGPVQGMRVYFSTGDAAEAQRVFAALAQGGQINLPIGATSFSPMFGMCIDQFGTPWMVGTDAPAETA